MVKHNIYRYARTHARTHVYGTPVKKNKKKYANYTTVFEEWSEWSQHRESGTRATTWAEG